MIHNEAVNHYFHIMHYSSVPSGYLGQG